jgi:hypothetical protein
MADGGLALTDALFNLPIQEAMLLAREVRKEDRTAQHEWRKVAFGLRGEGWKNGFH